MPIDWGSIILAGLVATAVMTVLMYMGKAMGMKMDMPRMLGLMFTGPENTGMVYTLGLMAHFMIGVVLAIGYALAFNLLGVSANWFWGAIFGVVHGIMAGIMMAMMLAMHPRMGEGRALEPPGPFGIRYGSMIPVGLMMLLLIYGAVIGWLYRPSGT